VAEKSERHEHLPVSELVSERPGPLSPFGEDVEFPLPPEKVAYVHPSPADRPTFASDK
jgi:succinate dehydrogenase / fumarate reductase, iron-sulfur subunit